PRSSSLFSAFSDATAAPEFYTLSLHDALPIYFFAPLLLLFFAQTSICRQGALMRPPSGFIYPLTGRRIMRFRFCECAPDCAIDRSEEHTSELQSRENLVCRLLLEKKKNRNSST